MALLRRGKSSNGATAADSAEAKPGRPHRALVIGGRGYNADTCVDWDDPRANVTDYDSVIVIPPAEDPGSDIQWRYKEKLEELLLTGGTLYVAAAPHTEWPGEGRRAVIQPNNYDWCPVPVGVDGRQGESIEAVDESVEWLFGRVRTWSATVTNHQRAIEAGFRGREDVAVLYEAENLASNRAGEALALRIRLALHQVESDGYFQRRVAQAPLRKSGWAYVIPVHTPWRTEEVVAEILARFLGRAAGAPVPGWLTETLMPPTPGEDQALAELAEAQRQIDERRPVLDAERAALRRVAGLLYETGPALEGLIAEALSELGVALGEKIGNEEYLALHDGVLATIEVKGNSKSASGNDYRAAMDHATLLTTEGMRARAILIVCAWRNTPLDAREAWFPDNVVTAAETQGTIALVRSSDLYAAVLALRRGEDVDPFVDAMFSTAGLVKFEGRGVPAATAGSGAAP